MVKVWKDANDIPSSQLPSKLREYKREMESIPRFDKLAGGRKIYQKKEFSVYKVSDGFVVHNTKRKFNGAHTHIRSFQVAKMLINCAIYKKLPKTRNNYLLRSLIRISTDKKYINEIQSLIEVRENKEKQNYVIKR